VAQATTERVALVTGSGAARVGRVVAQVLAERGYSLVIHFRRSARAAQETVALVASQGVRAVAVQADLADEKQIEGMFDQVEQQFGRLDVLVTAAAVWEPKALEQTTAADVRRQFEINTLGTFLCCRRAGLMMAAQEEGGVIVTIGDWATRRPYPEYAAYFVSKGAIPTLTRTLAVELARRNPRVRVNCVLPGPVMVPDELSEHEVQGVVAGTLLKRLGSPTNVAQAVLALVENDYVTGVCLPVDGGRTIAGA